MQDFAFEGSKYQDLKISKFLESTSKRETCRFRQSNGTTRQDAIRDDRIISSKKDVHARGVFIPGTTSGLSASLFSLLGEMICPAGLRGHGPDDVIRIRECYSDADVRISPSKVSCVPFFKGISTSPWLYFAYHRRYPYRRTLPSPRYPICIQTTPDTSSCILHIPIARLSPRW